MTEPVCTVVVCTRYRPGALGRCLRALTALHHPSFEVVLVDNTRDDTQAHGLAARFGARYMREPCLGLSRARNTGARTARGEIVAFLDDDATADPKWLLSHAAAFRDPTIAATTGRVISMHRDAVAAHSYAGDDDHDLGPRGFVVDVNTPRWFELANFGGLGLGGNLAVRRALFDSGWGFREDLGLGTGILGGEENYAFFDLIRSGYSVRYVPEAIVRHEPLMTPEQITNRKRRILRSSSAYLVMLVLEERGYRAAASPLCRGRTHRATQVLAECHQQ